MEVRHNNQAIISYDFNHEENRGIDDCIQNSLVRAYIQTKRAAYIEEHMLKPLSVFQTSDINTVFAIEEAYLKGALDAFNEFLSPIITQREELDNG